MCLDGIKRPALEVPFQLQIKDFFLNPQSTSNPIPVFYDGFMDGIVYEVTEQDYVIIDIKTHRRINIKYKDWSPLYANHTQCIPYATVLQHVLGRSPNSLRIKYIAVFVDFKDPIVRTYTYVKNKEEISDWLKGFWKQLNDIRMYYQMQWFRKNGNACMPYGNKCFAFDLCAGVYNKEFIKKSIAMMNVDATKIWQRPEPWVKAELDLGIV
jgi:hypothetical protein